MTTKSFGILGEDIATEYLKEKGYKILERNYVPKWLKTGKKEIDIIAKKKDILVFVEVKTGKISQDFYSQDKVNYEKQKNLIFAANCYLEEKKLEKETKWQIDVITVEVGEKSKIEHFENVVSDIDKIN